LEAYDKCELFTEFLWVSTVDRPPGGAYVKYGIS
jgi:hypothetical protein